VAESVGENCVVGQKDLEEKEEEELMYSSTGMVALTLPSPSLPLQREMGFVRSRICRTRLLQRSPCTPGSGLLE